MIIRQRLAEIALRAMQARDAAPDWLRPALGGALLIYLFVFMQGGLVILPIATVYLAFANPRALLVLLPAVLIVVPAIGFLGGLAYGVVGRVTTPWGRFGKVLQFIAGTWVYCVVLVFVILPWIDGDKTETLPPAVDWAIATGMGVLFGAVLGINATKDE